MTLISDAFISYYSLVITVTTIIVMVCNVNSYAALSFRLEFPHLDRPPGLCYTLPYTVRNICPLLLSACSGQPASTTAPTDSPTAALTEIPSEVPTGVPDITPTDIPDILPTETPDLSPTDIPDLLPTEMPDITPTGAPEDSVSEEQSVKEKLYDSLMEGMAQSMNNGTAELSIAITDASLEVEDLQRALGQAGYGWICYTLSQDGTKILASAPVGMTLTDCAQAINDSFALAQRFSGKSSRNR